MNSLILRTAVPALVGLMLLFSIERILRRFAGLPTARFGEVAMSQD